MKAFLMLIPSDAFVADIKILCDQAIDTYMSRILYKEQLIEFIHTMNKTIIQSN